MRVKCGRDSWNEWTSPRKELSGRGSSRYRERVSIDSIGEQKERRPGQDVRRVGLRADRVWAIYRN